MSAISCPRCDETVRVPESLLTGQVAPDVLVRCPWCRESFPVSDMIARVPPMLEIISADGRSVDSVMESVVEDFSSFEPQPEFDEYQLADPVQNRGPAIAPITRPGGGARGRAGAKQGSGIGSVIKVALGGLLAVPIAATILSLVGRPLPIDFGFFPFQGDSPGARSGRIVGGMPTRQAAAPSPSRSSSPVALPSSRVLSPAVPDDEVIQVASPEPSAAEDALVKIRDAGNSLDFPGSMDVPSTIEVPEIEVPAVTKPEIGGGFIPQTSKPRSNPDKPPFVMPGFKNDPEPTADSAAESPSSAQSISPELTKAIENANTTLGEAIEIMESGSIDRKLFGDAYRGIAEVASMLDKTSGDSPLVASLLERVASSPLAGMYSQVGRQWLNAKSRKTDGILLIGDAIESDAGTRIDFGEDQMLAVQYDDKLPNGRVAALGRIQSGSGEPLVELSAVQSVQ